MKPAWCIMIETSCNPSGEAATAAVLGVERFAQATVQPALTSPSGTVVDADVAVVDDVGAVAVDGADALDIDSRRIQWHQKHGQALVLWSLGISVGDQEDVLAFVRAVVTSSIR